MVAILNPKSLNPKPRPLLKKRSQNQNESKINLCQTRIIPLHYALASTDTKI